MSVNSSSTIPSLSMLCARAISQAELEGHQMKLSTKQELKEPDLPQQITALITQDHYFEPIAKKFESYNKNLEMITLQNFDADVSQSPFRMLYKNGIEKVQKMTSEEIPFLPEVFQIIFRNSLSQISEALEKKDKKMLKKLFDFYIDYQQKYLFSHLLESLMKFSRKLRNSILASLLCMVSTLNRPKYIQMIFDAVGSKDSWELLSRKKNILRISVEKGCAQSCVVILKAAGPKMMELQLRKDKLGFIPLHIAVDEKKEEHFEALIQAAGDSIYELLMNKKNEGDTPLFIAARMKGINYIKFVIDRYEKLPHLFLLRDTSGNTPFVYLLRGVSCIETSQLKIFREALGQYWFEAFSSTSRNGRTFFAEYVEKYKVNSIEATCEHFDLPKTPQLEALFFDALLTHNKMEQAQEFFKEALQRPQRDLFLFAAMHLPFSFLYLHENLPDKVKEIVSANSERLPLVIMLICVRILNSEQLSILFNRLKSLPSEIGSEILFTRSKDQHTVLHILSPLPRLKEIETILEIAGDNAISLVKIVDKNGMTATNYASYVGETAIASKFLSLIALKDRYLFWLKNLKGKNIHPFHFAASNGNADVIPIFLQRPEVKDDPMKLLNDQSCGQAPIHLAAGKGHINVIEQLIIGAGDRKNELFQAVDKKGRTPFDHAVLAGHLDCANYLSINSNEAIRLWFFTHKDKKGNTVIHKAVLSKLLNETVLKFLMSHFSEIDQWKIVAEPNNERKSAVHLYLEKFPQTSFKEVKEVFGLSPPPINL